MMEPALSKIIHNFCCLASQLYEAQYAVISLFNDGEQELISSTGFSEAYDPSRFKLHNSLLSEYQALFVSDATEDARYFMHPLVTEIPPIQFFASHPLVTQTGDLLGVICVFDHAARVLDPVKNSSLALLGEQLLFNLTQNSQWLATKQLNTSLSEKAAFYDTLLKSANVSIISTSPDGIITSFSVGAETMLGYQAHELIGKQTVCIFHEMAEVEKRAAELRHSLGQVVEPGFEVFVTQARKGQPDTSKWTYVRKDKGQLKVSLTVTAMFDGSKHLVGFLGIARDITDSEQTKESLSVLADIFRHTGEMAKIGGWEFDLLNAKLKWTDEVFHIHELEPPDAPSLQHALDFYPAEVRPKINSAIEIAISSGTPWDMELPFITAKGKHLWVRAHGCAIMAQGKATKLMGAFQDITNRKQIELDLAWVNRALLMLGKCNETLIHISDEMHLLTEICRIAVDVGGYKMAWVGYAEEPDYSQIIPKAHFGRAENFLQTIPMNWSRQQLKDQIPCWKSMQNGLSIAICDLMLDASYPLKDEALKLGFRSMLALPLKNKAHRPFGVLALYLGEAHNFAHDEIRLLQDMADNLASGIVNIRAEKERKQLHDAMLKVATSVSVASGEAFFTQIVANMASALGAQAGYVAQLTPGNPKKGQTLAAVVDNEQIENFEFTIANSLAENLFGSKNLRIVAKSACTDFANLSMMKWYPYQGFAGLCLYDSNDQPIGLLFVFFKHEIVASCYDLISSILKIFAARTVSELERQTAAIAIRENARFVKTITDALPAMVAYWDRDLRCRFANKPYLTWFGKSPEHIVGTSMHSLLGDTLFNLNKSHIDKALEGELQQFERTMTRADGTSSATWANYIPDIDADGSVNGFFVLVTDIGPIKQAESELRLAASVFQNTIEGIMVTDTDGTILSVNPAFSAISGYSTEDAIGNTPRLLKSGRHDHAFYAGMWDAIITCGFWHGEVWNASKNGALHPDLMTITAVKNKDGEISNYLGIFSDNTEYKMQEEQRLLEESEHRDALVREVHHRIKNNLQSVASLLSNFAAAYPGLSEAFNSAITQVKSIALIHGLQGTYANSEVRLAELVKAIVANNQILWKTHITVHIADSCLGIQIAEKEAVPMALVLNELILNATKHSSIAEEIIIRMSQDIASSKVNVSIQNHGILRFAEPANSPKFGTGLQLVSSLLPKKNAALSWKQVNDSVITNLDLSPPVILIQEVAKIEN